MLIIANSYSDNDRIKITSTDFLNNLFFVSMLFNLSLIYELKILSSIASMLFNLSKIFLFLPINIIIKRYIAYKLITNYLH